VLDHMPIRNVIAMLRASKPADAANVFLSMTQDRIGLLMLEFEPADLARMLHSAKPAQKPGLVAAMPAERRLPVLRQLSMTQLVELIAGLPPGPAALLLSDIPPRVAAEVYAELPGELKQRLPELLGRSQPVEFWSVLYERRAAEAVVGAARRVSWLDERAGELLAEVFGKLVHVALRYRPETPLTGTDIDHAANRGNWREIAGMVLLTNVLVAESARGQIQAISDSGRPIEALHWASEADDGVFKRVLVRMTS
jgi:hypothetical protein